jgi:hypothetical protein
LFFFIPARPHTAKVSINFLTLNEMKMAFIRPIQHPQTFLFAYLKRNLLGYQAENLSELLVRIQVILRVIPGETLVEIFLEWMKRL